MKIHHLADVCTALECVCAVIILAMAWFDIAPEYVLCVFFVGEMFDAIDGPLARHFRYPKDGKHRWWRTHAAVIDQLSDLLLGTVTCFYVAYRIDYLIGFTAFSAATMIGLGIQTLAYDFPPLGLNWLKSRPRLGKTIVLGRRWLYVALVVFAVALLLWSTKWPLSAKITITAIFCSIGAFLFICKLNRLLEVKTTVEDEIEIKAEG